LPSFYISSANSFSISAEIEFRSEDFCDQPALSLPPSLEPLAVLISWLETAGQTRHATADSRSRLALKIVMLSGNLPSDRPPTFGCYCAHIRKTQRTIDADAFAMAKPSASNHAKHPRALVQAPSLLRWRL